jgi:putative exporter of polyketide antibiotics
VDSSRTVERTESKGEDSDAAAGRSWCSLRNLILLLLLAALVGAVAYYIMAQREAGGGFSAEKVPVPYGTRLKKKLQNIPNSICRHLAKH